MKNAFFGIVTLVMVMITSSAFGSGSYGSTVNSICGETLYNGDCTFCHASSSKSTSTPAKTAFLAGGSTLTDYFCPVSAPAPADNDNDGFTVDQGDCNDNDQYTYPGASSTTNPARRSTPLTRCSMPARGPWCISTATMCWTGHMTSPSIL